MNRSERWRATYARKLASVQQAISLIKPGRRILIGSGAAEPVTLVEGLVAHGNHLADNEIVHLLTLGPAPYVSAELAQRFRHAAFFIGPNVRDAVQEGRADFIPVFLSEIYPWKEERRECLLGGQSIIVRPVRMSDEEALQRLFYELSDESTYRRFMAHRRVHSHEEMQELVDSDYELDMGVVACDPELGDLIGMSRYDVDPATRLAEIAFVVRDNWQGRGVGTLLMKRMTEIARARGLAGFSADVLARNRAMLMVFQRSGLEVVSQFDGSSYHLEARFEHASSQRSSLLPERSTAT